MKLKLLAFFFSIWKPIINLTNDRIVEIAVLKLHPDGRKQDKVWRVNPECPIPQASAVHGIYDEDVADEPNFKHSPNPFTILSKILIWPDITQIVLISLYWQRRC